MKIKQSYLVYGILSIVFIIAALPWIQQGVPVTDDYRHHAMRMSFIKEQIQSFEYSEWMPYLYGGWPFMEFYHPMFYVISLPIITLLGPIVSLKAMTLVCYLFALLGTFYGVNLLFNNKNIALFASVAYFMSSHFLFHATVSGALPRLMAIGLVPIVSCIFIKSLEEKTKKCSNEFQLGKTNTFSENYQCPREWR